MVVVCITKLKNFSKLSAQHVFFFPKICSLYCTRDKRGNFKHHFFHTGVFDEKKYSPEGKGHTLHIIWFI